jgi:2-polyprenyl-3-methyl-5-hydroxy-6-metoxy-1,4-benzoquinol methylase
MTIDYDHSANLHTRSGAEAGLAVVLGRLAGTPSSMIDVGCGTGTWLRAATMLGVPDVRGVDGVIAPADELEVARSLITQVDLTQPLPLDRTFDLALCLEVAEHLDAPCGGVLVDSLVRASRQVVFSAACPGQMGQHHVNCQWPLYWQAEFNARGFACSDDVR